MEDCVRVRGKLRGSAAAGRRGGFALIVSLSILGLVLLVILTVSTLVRMEMMASATQQQDLEARLTARLALAVAAGELQATMGVDRASSLLSTADPEERTAHWSRTFTAGTERWLASGGENAETGGDDLEWTERLSPINGGPEGRIEVAWESGGAEDQRFAWWVGDEGMKTSFAAPDRSLPGLEEGRGLVPENPTDAFVLAQVQARRPRQELFFPQVDFDAHPIDQVEQVRQSDQYALLDAAAQNGPTFHDLTPLALGLPTRPDGGLKRNLSAGAPALADDPFLTPEAAVALDEYLNPSARWEWPNRVALRRGDVDPVAPTRFPTEWSELSPNNRDMPAPELIEGMPVDSLLPVITEMKIYCAVFNEGRDGQHRLRYYGGFQVWNPYAFPLKIHTRDHENGLFFVNVTGTQHLEVALYPPGSDLTGAPLRSFIVNTDTFPQIANANTKNRQEEISFNFQVIMETAQSRPPEAVLLPGQVYHAEWPDVLIDDNALSRLLTNEEEDEWWAEWAPGRGEKPADYGADHIVRIRSVDADGNPAAPRLNIQLKRFIGDNDRNGRRPADYPGELVMEYRNVPFEPFDLTLSGAEYYLGQSNQYNRADYRFAYHFKIENEDELPGILELLAERVDLRQPIIDFDDPDVARLFYVEADAERAVRSGIAFSEIDDGENPFWAQSLNSSEGRAGSFRLYDHPNRPPVSVAALRYLPVVGKNPFMIGTAEGGEWNQLFDRYFLTGATEDGAEFADVPASPRPRRRAWGPGESLPPLPNHRMRISETRLADLGRARPTNPRSMAELARDPDLARALWIEGSFNLNSTSARAWTALLSQHIPDWESRLAQQGAGSSRSLDRVFFRHTFNGGTALPAGRPPLTDLELASVEDLKRQQEVHFGQSFRWLGDDDSGAAALDGLAEALVDRIADYHSANGPIRSLADFLDSGLLAGAIEDSGINDDITESSSLYLREGDVLELIAPVLTTRSDTFKVRIAGENTGASGSPVRRHLEATMVRTHDYVDPAANPSDTPPDELSPVNARFGRSFRVLDYRWLSEVHNNQAGP